MPRAEGQPGTIARRQPLAPIPGSPPHGAGGCVQCSFFEHDGKKIMYRRYASLFFIVGTNEEVRSHPPGRLRPPRCIGAAEEGAAQRQERCAAPKQPAALTAVV